MKTLNFKLSALTLIAISLFVTVSHAKNSMPACERDIHIKYKLFAVSPKRSGAQIVLDKKILCTGVALAEMGRVPNGPGECVRTYVMTDGIGRDRSRYGIPFCNAVIDGIKQEIKIGVDASELIRHPDQYIQWKFGEHLQQIGQKTFEFSISNKSRKNGPARWEEDDHVRKQSRILREESEKIILTADQTHFKTFFEVPMVNKGNRTLDGLFLEVEFSEQK